MAERPKDEPSVTPVFFFSRGVFLEVVHLEGDYEMEFPEGAVVKPRAERYIPPEASSALQS